MPLPGGGPRDGRAGRRGQRPARDASITSCPICEHITRPVTHCPRHRAGSQSTHRPRRPIWPLQAGGHAQHAGQRVPRPWGRNTGPPPGCGRGSTQGCSRRSPRRDGALTRADARLGEKGHFDLGRETPRRGTERGAPRVSGGAPGRSGAHGAARGRGPGPAGRFQPAQAVGALRGLQLCSWHGRHGRGACFRTSRGLPAEPAFRGSVPCLIRLGSQQPRGNIPGLASCALPAATPKDAFHDTRLLRAWDRALPSPSGTCIPGFWTPLCCSGTSSSGDGNTGSAQGPDEASLSRPPRQRPRRWAPEGRLASGPVPPSGSLPASHLLPLPAPHTPPPAVGSRAPEAALTPSHTCLCSPTGCFLRHC